MSAMSTIENSKIILLKEIFKEWAPDQVAVFFVSQDVLKLLIQAHVDCTGLEVCLWDPQKDSIKLCKFVREL